MTDAKGLQKQIDELKDEVRKLKQDNESLQVNLDLVRSRTNPLTILPNRHGNVWERV